MSEGIKALLVVSVLMGVFMLFLFLLYISEKYGIINLLRKPFVWLFGRTPFRVYCKNCKHYSSRSMVTSEDIEMVDKEIIKFERRIKSGTLEDGIYFQDTLDQLRQNRETLLTLKDKGGRCERDRHTVYDPITGCREGKEGAFRNLSMNNRNHCPHYNNNNNSGYFYE